MKNKKKVDVKKIFTVRLEPKYINKINQLASSKKNQFDTKTDVIKFALNRCIFNDKFVNDYYAYMEMNNNNRNMFADIHNYIEANNEYVAMVNHIGNNVNQIAHRLNLDHKANKPTDDLKLHKHDVSVVDEAGLIIDKCGSQIIKNNNQIRVDLAEILHDFKTGNAKEQRIAVADFNKMARPILRQVHNANKRADKINKRLDRFNKKGSRY